jgi:DNA-binding transcriptional regulator YiaG
MTSKQPEHPQGNAPSAQQIRTLRDKLGLTQAAAAALVYRSARNWQQWELGERRMDPAVWELFTLKAAMAAPRHD